MTDKLKETKERTLPLCVVTLRNVSRTRNGLRKRGGRIRECSTPPWRNRSFLCNQPPKVVGLMKLWMISVPPAPSRKWGEGSGFEWLHHGTAPNLFDCVCPFSPGLSPILSLWSMGWFLFVKPPQLLISFRCLNRSTRVFVGGWLLDMGLHTGLPTMESSIQTKRSTTTQVSLVGVRRPPSHSP